MNDLWVPISLFVSIAIVVSLYFSYRYRGRVQLQKTLRQAMDKGQELSPEIIERLAGPKPRPDGDKRRGVIALAISAGIAAFAFVLDESDALRPMLAIACIPALIGVAYLLLWVVSEQPGAGEG